MKMHKRTLAAVVLGLALAALTPAQQPDAAQAALKAATDKEVVDGDLKSAIALYGKVAATYKTNKAVAAQALFRLGQCHEKLGQADAAKAYEQLIRQYADQKEAASARARLAALRGPAAQTPSARLAWTVAYPHNLGTIAPGGRFHVHISGAEGGLSVRDLETGENRIVPGAQKVEYPFESIVSPDGKWIAYAALPAGGLEQLRVVAVEGGSPRIVFQTGDDVNVSWVIPLGWTPDNKEVLVTFNRPNANYQLGMISVETGRLRVLKEFDFGFFRWASLSPDGKWMAYTEQTSPDGVECDIHVMRIDGTSDRKLIDHPSDDINPHWTADGNGIVWRTNRRGSDDAYFVAVKDGQVVGTPLLVKSNVPGQLLGVSRTGTLYYEDQPGTSDVHVLELDDATGMPRGTPRKLPLAFSGRKLSTVISPDGEWIAYIRDSMATPRVRFVAMRSLRTGQEREFYPKIKDLRSIAWTPDGKNLALFGRNMRDEFTLCLMELAAGSLRTVMSEPAQARRGYNLGFFAPSFSPDLRTFYPPTWNGVPGVAMIAVSTEGLQIRELWKVERQSNGRPWVSPDGRLLVGVQDGRNGNRAGFVIVDAQTGEKRYEWDAGPNLMLRLNGWTPDGRHLILLAAPPSGNDNVTRQLRKNVEIWRVSLDGTDVKKYPAPAPLENPARLQPQANGNFIVQTTGDFGQQVWAVDHWLPKH